ncbi:MAG: hypothetical protein Q9195_007630 [Heterodermia aff. obscurata]
MSSTDDVISPLFRIPPEIRDKIYRNLLSACYSSEEDEAPVWGEKNPPVITLDWYGPLDTTGIYTSILATCKQVAFEDTRILYTSNILKFEGSKSMSKWLDTIGSENVQAVRSVEIYGNLADLNIRMLENVLQRCTGLKRFQIDAHMMSCAPPREQYVCTFLGSAKWVLENHATLKMVASGHPGGYEHKPLRKGQYPGYWDAICVTFLADMTDAFPEDGFRFDVQEAIEQHSGSTHDNYVLSPIVLTRGNNASAAPADTQAP